MEVRVAGPDDGVADELTGDAVVGMEAIALPRIVAEHDVGAQAPNRPDDLGACRCIVLQLAVDPIEEDHLAGAGPGESAGRLALLLAAPRDERCGVRLGIPRALGAIGAHEVMHDASRIGPLGERGAGPELDVVGVRADRQSARRDVEVDRRLPRQRRGVAAQRRLARIVRNHPGSSVRRAGWARSSGVSTSRASRGSRRTSTRSPGARLAGDRQRRGQVGVERPSCRT